MEMKRSRYLDNVEGELNTIFMKKYSRYGCIFFYGRSERIRTFDPLHPMQVRYQAAPHSDFEGKWIIKVIFLFSKHISQVVDN